jgi:hypothetical protein
MSMSVSGVTVSVSVPSSISGSVSVSAQAFECGVLVTQVCLCACVRACVFVRACVRVCVRACVRSRYAHRPSNVVSWFLIPTPRVKVFQQIVNAESRAPSFGKSVGRS